MVDDPRRAGARGGRVLRGAVRGIAWLFVGVGLIRVMLYGLYALEILPIPLESHQLESKMVLLAYRAQAGLSLYPEWRDYPHVANFFAPIDFLVVGGLGRLAGSDLRGLFLIGRGVSFAAGLLETVVLGVWAGRRYGRMAGVVAALLSVGGRPMDGFSVTTRPDMLAELLGVAGFALAGAGAGVWRASGVAAIVLAVFTKQTTAVYLVAAALAMAAEGRWRRALGTFAAGAGAIALVVAAVTFAVEPRFARSLLGEAATPWDLAAWLALMKRLGVGSLDLFLIPAIGLTLWTRGRDRDPGLAALTAVLMASGLVLAMKRGADVNYFLGLRAAEAMAAAALWSAAREPGPPRRALALGAAMLAAVVAVSLSALVNCVGLARLQALSDYFRGPAGLEFLNVHRAACRAAADPGGRVLTDSGYIDLHAGERAVFGDPWLFRMLVETGQVDPKVLIERIDSGYYATVITNRDIRHPDYPSFEFALPRVLVERLRDRYEFVGVNGGLCIYTRKGRGAPPAAGP